MSTLIVNKLSCFYQNIQVLNSLDLALARNEIVCLLGESGCGKTTLLNILAGMETPSSGSIWLQEGLTMHMVFQNPAASFNPRMTIGRSLSEGLINKKVPLAQREKILQELLKNLNKL